MMTLLNRHCIRRHRVHDTSTHNKFILPIITFIIFLGIWEMVIGHYQPVLLPGPALVGKSIWTFIVTGEIFQHLAISLWRFVAGFVVALLVAIPLGFLLEGIVGYTTLSNRYFN